MIDAEDLPSIELACRLRNRTFSDTCRYCLELADSTSQDETWDKLLAAACAGYVAGVRHERQRQRQKHHLLKQIKKEDKKRACRRCHTSTGLHRIIFK